MKTHTAKTAGGTSPLLAKADAAIAKVKP